MASKKFFKARANYIYPTLESDDNDINPILTPENVFEFEEADVWNSNVVSSVETKKTIPSSRSSKKVARKVEMDRTPVVTCASLPLNIPDWSKIYRDDRRKEHKELGDYIDDESDYEDDVDQDGRVLPPHEYLARRRGASFSVHEGIGRTLKGRDLRQVRNAIWKRVGFED